MLMYLFHKLSTHTALIYTVQFALVRALGWNHCFVVMLSNNSIPERSSVERQYLPVIGTTLPPLQRDKEKDPRCTALTSTAQDEKTFEIVSCSQSFYWTLYLGKVLVKLNTRVHVGVPAIIIITDRKW